ncbi:MlaA family lipoprotein [Geminisphaera colitermitum]|uniref:MlaA family lipoprotein n=1 Tax=Geminisphaera colitermitum TaxID=1148786 RepID=UPI00019653BC|nr:VacJ family lipoprotein [Geminisphaera colitermitum]
MKSHRAHPLSVRPALALALLFTTLALAPTASHAQKTPARPDPEIVEEMDEYATLTVFDPLEPLNRLTFKFNDGLYDYVLRPISKGYTKVVPEPVRGGLSNFFENIKFPIRFVNSVLQFKFKRAGQETGKFFVNTIGGLGGFIKLSDEVPSLADIPREDTGQTIGRWGIGAGPYLVLPILGPGSLRDTVGLVGDYYLNPLVWNDTKDLLNNWETSLAIDTLNVVNETPNLLRTYDAPRQNAIDPYLSVRNAYLQYREAEVKK